jgi:hypothetical protein
MRPVIVSLGSALEAAEGNIVRFSQEIVRQLVARLDGEWDARTIKLESQVTEDGLFLTLSDGPRQLVVKVELGPFSSQLSVAVH